MASVWDELAQRAKDLGANWTSYTVLGSFALYVLGYLTLRFHLTALGIGADLTVLDERYLFTGARCLIYLVSSIPSLVLLVLLAVIPVYLPYRVLPAAIRAKIAAFVGLRVKSIWSWWSHPERLALTGIIFSVLVIQLVMRQCFLLNNLLLAPALPINPAWLRDLLLAKNDGLMALYFAGLLAGMAVSLGLFMVLRKQTSETAFSQFLKPLLAFLIAVQILMIPVNYGILVVDKSMPRVADLGSPGSLQQGEQSWLVWEGNEGVTFLVRKQDVGKEDKRLITLPRQAVTRIEITAYDRIIEILFGGHGNPPPPGLSQKGQT